MHEQRKRWSDAKSRKVEGLVAEFVAGLMRTAVALSRQEEEHKRRETEERMRALATAQLRSDIQDEAKKLKQFNEWVDAWEREEKLRRFIAVYAEKSVSWAAEKQPDDEAWIEWATQQADPLDPVISEKPPSVLDRQCELN
jgi:hypothetical protein